MERGRWSPWIGLVFALAFPLLPTNARADMPAPTPQEARYEVRFLTGMIDHHAMAVMMAELCESRAVHQELMALCEQIRVSQTQEIEMMQSWLLDWYGLTYEHHMPPGHHNKMERLAALTGEEFEIGFMEMMIGHHEKAVREGLHCVDRAYHPELIGMCENIVQAQLEEIALMQRWLCDWYDICKN